MKDHSLIISTSFPTQVLGLCRGDRQVDETLIDTKNNHLESVVVNLERMLARHGLGARDIGGVVVDVGPGSFTGIRIGVSVARAFCQSAGVTAVPVSSLDALAQGASAEGAALVAVLKEARKSRIYAAFYRPEDGRPGLGRVGGEHDLGIGDLLGLRELLDAAGSGRIVFTGDAVPANEAFIRANFREHLGFRPCLCPAAGDYAACAASGRFPAVGWERLLPNYVRKSDAETARAHG